MIKPITYYFPQKFPRGITRYQLLGDYETIWCKSNTEFKKMDPHYLITNNILITAYKKDMAIASWDYQDNKWIPLGIQ